MHGIYRVAAAVPEIRVADTGFNAGKIRALAADAERKSAALVIFPELCITGYTCADLFQQELLVENGYAALKDIAGATRKINTALLLGLPVFNHSGLYNCAIIVHRGKIRGVVPKSFNPNYREFYEKRWFRSGRGIRHEDFVLNGEKTVFGTNIIFEFDRHFRFAAEICEDLWNVIPPSSYHALAGATVVVNLSASNELVSKADYRRELVRDQSARCICAYAYTSSGVSESTTDLVFGGHSMIAENGSIIAENERFSRHGCLTCADIDCQRLSAARSSESSFGDNQNLDYLTIHLDPANEISQTARYVDPHPFVPSSVERRDERCMEIFSIQAAGLAKRIEHAKSKKAVIGISGGLDSTLALLVTVEAFKLLGRKTRDIVAITMPGFGTGKRTYGNSLKLAECLDVELREIDISEACHRHFTDIGHDPKIHDVTYENVQARERTQILMDIANKEGGLLVGTGDLSELALGWCTYNGDHMSMYAVNCSVPKTLIRHLVKWVASKSGKRLERTLLDIVDTPVTPELLPRGKKGEIVQKTEEILGPYELHDFFLYHTVKYGATPEKIKFLAKIAFKDKYPLNEISRCLEIFIKRFFSQQFKRSCLPDGPKVGTICLSPRGDWRMPSDASPDDWLKTEE